MKPHIIVLRETATQSLISDAGTVLAFVALIGIGVFLDSSALQWVGAIIGFLAIFRSAAGKGKRLTIAEARAQLDEIERDMAGREAGPRNPDD